MQKGNPYHGLRNAPIPRLMDAGFITMLSSKTQESYLRLTQIQPGWKTCRGSILRDQRDQKEKRSQYRRSGAWQEPGTWDSGTRPGRTMTKKLLQGLHPRGFKTRNWLLGWRRSLKAIEDGEATHKLTAGTGITRGQEGHRHEARAVSPGRMAPGRGRVDATRSWSTRSALLLQSRGESHRSPRKGSPRGSVPHNPRQSQRRGRRFESKGAQDCSTLPQTLWCRPRHLRFWLSTSDSDAAGPGATHWMASIWLVQVKDEP